MLYHVGDKFLVNDIEVTIKFINNGKAWLFPVDEGTDSFGNKLLPWCAITALDEKGKLPNGKRATAVVNSKCGAV